MSLVRQVLRDRQVALLVALRVVVLVAVATEVPDFGNAATDRYQVIAQSDGTPYRDFPVEYAPGELLIAIGVGSTTPAVAVAGLAILAFLGDLLAGWALARGWGLRTARRYLWLGTPLLVFIYRRADLVAVGIATLGLMLSRRNRDGPGGLVLAVATLTRFWPVVLAPIWAVEKKWPALRTFAISLATGIACWIAFGGMDSIRQVATFRRATGFELESTVGVVVWALTGEHRVELDTNRTGFIPSWFSPTMLLLLVAVSVLVWLGARSRRLDPAGAPAVAAICALLLLSPVFSPQYVAWLVPWAAIAGGDSVRWPRLVTAPILMTSFLVLSWSIHLGLGPGRTQVLLAARNLSVLLILVAYFFWLRGVERGIFGQSEQPIGRQPAFV